MNNIVLVGFPGAGKSTVGRRLADKLGMAFIDLDLYIEEKYHTAVPLLFQRYGEPAFRMLEYAALKEVLEADNAVIATGGGTPCHHDAMTLINSRAHSIYLKFSEEQLVEHLLHSKKKRPLTQHLSEPELRAYVHETLAKRERYYLRATTVWTPTQANELPFVSRVPSLS
ncbi:MAG: AAA family ATPase [Bacteroidales bacterium]|nr:AAA family ATPase [Bacteroidales bacterium]